MIGWILLGLIAGALAKWIMPGNDPGGFFVTVLIGIAGAFVGGWIGKILDFLPASNPGGMIPGVGSILTATLGAVVLLFLYRKMKS
ncbi:GlsB/YeaQ/YmgE family stress response membrane protein [Verrucomicrobiaceae bacterium N1E253]|uniref:GlsB/YeaQ/YmgE family stress response membrane protein n=1 Tax=Oceaniferula marina TaxID=2748318 RepID=A0A851GPY6_9BACT|nr:GlsB/YeaQ/YmgE family stress response membrane protein [Oceaniferula marina]NWK56214.1 GlsB/YeaQ/YmgE family stress response membrane protein [Oceaniferula marina]